MRDQRDKIDENSYIRPFSTIRVVFGRPKGHLKITCQGGQEAASIEAIISPELEHAQRSTYLPSLLQFVGDQVAAIH